MFKKSALYTVVLGVALSGSLLAQPDFEEGDCEKKFKGEMSRQHKSGMRGMDRLRRVFSQLDLSEEQKSSLKTLKENNKEAVQATRSRIRPLKEQMRELLSADEVDETAVKNLSIQIAEEKAEQMLLMASIKKQATEFLTEEQKNELQTMKEKRAERMGKRRSRG